MELGTKGASTIFCLTNWPFGVPRRCFLKYGVGRPSLSSSSGVNSDVRYALCWLKLILLRTGIFLVFGETIGLRLVLCCAFKRRSDGGLKRPSVVVLGKEFILFYNL